MNREKLFLIVRREYLSRLRSKVFIVTTILAPVVMVLLLVLPAFIHMASSDRVRTFMVYDETGVLAERLVQSDSVAYQTADRSASELREQLVNGELEAYIILPHEIVDGMGHARLFHDGSVGMATSSRVRSDIQTVIRDYRLERADVSEEIRKILSERVVTESRTVTDDGEDGQDTTAFVFIGIFMGFIIYGAMFGYGAVILRSVMEEKTSRVVEVIASAVKPFELLTGKVIGVALLGLTQFTIWILSGSLLLSVAGPLLSRFQGVAGTGEAGEMERAAMQLPTIDPSLWVGFVLFFLLGFLIYSALFAAVGSAVDQESDAGQLQAPIILLIVIPILFLMAVSEDPSSRMATILSMVPFFAPILMPVRMAVIPVPFWELFVTITGMTLTFVVLMWMSARIYRTGILMYGKKASLKDLWHWVRQG